MEKAVAYIRVSTKSDSQLHSYEYQLEYWKNKIESEDNKILVSVYQDYGISGRSIHKRPQLLKLLEDAKNMSLVLYILNQYHDLQETQQNFSKWLEH